MTITLPTPRPTSQSPPSRQHDWPKPGQGCSTRPCQQGQTRKIAPSGHARAHRRQQTRVSSASAMPMPGWSGKGYRASRKGVPPSSASCRFCSLLAWWIGAFFTRLPRSFDAFQNPPRPTGPQLSWDRADRSICAETRGCIARLDPTHVHPPPWTRKKKTWMLAGVCHQQQLVPERILTLDITTLELISCHVVRPAQEPSLFTPSPDPVRLNDTPPATRHE